ncbi:MAG: sugar transferase [Thermoanaerobaculia bacterium]
MSTPRTGPTLYQRWGKRALDLALAVPLGLLVLPLGLALAALVRLRMGPPTLFRHVRPGLEGEPFTLLKLRTMLALRDAEGQRLPDGERLTPLGRFLRRTSLDELPALWNVVRGEMSLVGPRPLLMEYLPRYTREQARRHEVRPGITGWAQVHGRNALSWEEKFARDVWYVDHVSPGLDLRILARTVLAVLRREGINARGHATMPEFRGTEQSGSGLGA